ncbi:MAG: phage tail tape measure protein [Rhodopseudomonas sp.]|uniref:phage tail tape measure protein n=1 Tax=Rhodopseudomonas sp. TaxID=1078 RepID=UPI0039E66C72
MKSIEARAVISAADRTGGVFEAVARKLQRLSGVASRASSRVAAAGSVAAAADRAGYAGGRVGGAAGLAAGRLAVGAASRVLAPAAVAYGGIKSVKRFAETDMALTRIGITADATDEEISKLNKSVRDLAFATGKPFGEVAAGLENLVAGGSNLNEALSSLPAIVKTAQAAGAEVNDMASTTLALTQSLDIAPDKIQAAFDVLVTGGKAGKFELKDMARYMASLGPIASAAGLKGEDGLKRIVSVLQAIRQGSGTSEEAATAFRDILSKMETEETVNKFKKMGVDIRAELDKTRKAGGDLIQTLLDQTEKALKGDMSKLPLLFGENDSRRGILALLTYKKTVTDVLKQLNKSAGSTMNDLDRVLQRPQTAVNRLSGSFDRLWEAVGRGLDAAGASKGMDKVAKTIDEAVDERNKPEEERNRIRADVDRRTALKWKALSIEGKIKFYESLDGSKDPTIWERLNGHPGADREKLLEALRLELFGIRGAMSAASPQDLPPIMSEKEIEAFKAAQEELRKRAEAEAAKQQSKDVRPGVPLPRSDPRKERPWENNILDLPPVKAELTGSAEVKGEAVVKVQIEPSSEFLRVVDRAQAVSVKLDGMVKANGPGSTGRSSPDAAPGGKGASGKW